MQSHSNYTFAVETSHSFRFIWIILKYFSVTEYDSVLFYSTEFFEMFLNHYARGNEIYRRLKILKYGF